MTILKRTLMLSLLATSTAFATPAAAAIVVDTGTPTGGGQSLGVGSTLAGLFTLSAATRITSVEGFISGPGANGNIFIYTGGVDPQFSGLLFSASFAIIPAAPAQWQGTFGQSWDLAAGQYWVRFTSDSFNVMPSLAPNPLSQYASASQLAGPWQQLGSRAGYGVRIAGDPITDPNVGAVPEAATWAMMLIGFGTIGGAMRSRRRVRIAYS